MRAITVRQPFAWAIIHGGKNIENRSRNIAGTYRGRVAIHAARQLADLDYEDPQSGLVARAVGEVARRLGTQYAPAMATDPNTPGNRVHPRYGWRGAIIGTADLLDVHHNPGHSERWDATAEASTTCSPWAEHGPVWHLVLADPQPIAAPIPCRGYLGLWTIPDHIAALLETAPAGGHTSATTAPAGATPPGRSTP